MLRLIEVSIFLEDKCFEEMVCFLLVLRTSVFR